MSVVAPWEDRLLAEPEQPWREVDRRLPVPAARFAWLGWLNQLLAFLLLIPGLPVIAVLGLITRLTSRGPALYRQSRVGLRGRSFLLYKIRTMSNNAEAATGPVWSPGVLDPRVTAFGRFLRKTHLDEFPQLFNVLCGEMSLIGPRPERPEFTQFLAQEIPGYVGRLGVKPGITGLAQINLPPDSDLESVRKKLELDLDYICNSTWWLDVYILLCTALKMLGFSGLRIAKWLGLKRRPTGTRREISASHQSFAVVDGSASHEHARLDSGRVNGHQLPLFRIGDRTASEADTSLDVLNGRASRERIVQESGST